MQAANTFVLVHGGFHGGWCWQAVAAELRSRGHCVYTPTQTGCGERSHLLSADITLATFIDDVANVITWEDLADVVLVGHSFGGITVSGVADRMPQRLARLVYLDSLILEDGQSVFGRLDPQTRAERIAAAQADGGAGITPPPAAVFGIRDEARASELQARLTPQPLGTYTSALRLANPVGNGVPAVYVQCTDPVFAGLQSTRDWVAANGMPTVELDTGHDAMITAPERLAALLVELAASAVRAR